MSIETMITFEESTKFTDYLRMIINQNQNNYQIVEAVCFVWDSATKLPPEFSQINIFRPFGFENY